MSFSVDWAESAAESLRALPHWRDAARVARAVATLAETGEGDLRRVADTRELRLYVRPYVVRLTIDAATQRIQV